MAHAVGEACVELYLLYRGAHKLAKLKTYTRCRWRWLSYSLQQKNVMAHAHVWHEDRVGVLLCRAARAGWFAARLDLRRVSDARTAARHGPVLGFCMRFR